jgi:hypothetical protein
MSPARIALVALCAALAFAPVARAQDVDTGVQVDAGDVDAGDVDAGVDAGEGADAGTPADEQPTDPSEVELPEGHVPVVALTLEPIDDVMTGDLVTATITVTLPEGDDVAVPHQTLGDLETHDQRHSDRPEGEHRVFTFELDFLMLEPGDHELPPIRLRVVTADGVVGSVHTESRMIHVGSLVANEPDAQPRPPTTPVVVMQDDYTLAWVLGILGIIAATALITWFVARWWRRQPKPVPPPPPPRPAWEVATEKIEALRKRLPASIADGKQVEIVDGVSDALREYFGNRFDFNGLESTSDEVIARLRNQRLGPVALEEVIALLGDADLVKFAKAVPDADNCEKMIEGSLRMVRGTMSIPQPAIAAPARPAGDRGSRTRNSAPGGAPMSAADERMLRAASRAAKAAAEAAAPTLDVAAAPKVAESEEGELREDGSRVIPNTNPPPPPGAAAEPEAAAEIDRPTPVGFADPSVKPPADAKIGPTSSGTPADDDDGGPR